jgi:hypothetical protein
MKPTSEEPQEPAQESSEIPFETLFDGCRDLEKQIGALADRLSYLAHMFDSLGAAESHPEGSGKRRFAELRDHADFCLSGAAENLLSHVRVRAKSSRSEDLVCHAVSHAMGDGNDCIELIEIYHRMMGDDTEGTGQIDAETFPDQFLWDLAQRVEAFPAFAERYPQHLYFAARHLHGLPMMVSHHLDVTQEFHRLSEMLGMGTWHPLDVSPRRKRGANTPAMKYLEPVLWRMHNIRQILIDIGTREGLPIPSERIAGVVARRRIEDVSEAEIEIYRKLAEIPRLVKSAALDWSKEIIVPYILLSDGADPANAADPFLRNIWNHRGVKSVATFRSRLESAVTDFLTRYSRERDRSRYS